MTKTPYTSAEDSRERKIYEEFGSKAEAYIAQILSGFTAADYKDIKVIHDPVWGTMKFYPWELQVLDSPLLQRLRNINQLGLAVLTYPSAHHSRFEHTLGVIALVTRMTDSINDNYGHGIGSDQRIISFADMYKLRLAALLHDVGHSFFSHLSERMYGDTAEFKALRDAFEIFSHAQPHEIMGYMIINTPSFKSFFKSSVCYPDGPETEAEVDAFFDTVGRMIVGVPVKETVTVNGREYTKNYLTEMINGQFDADSLDYLRRDSYITGLSLTYHIDRFLYKIKIMDRVETIDGEERAGRHLTIPISGVSTVEEMIFGKQMLTRYIYQHQKVLAADALVYDIVNGLKENGKLHHPCDYLYYSDDDIYKIYDESGDEDLKVPAYYMPIHSDSQKKISDVVKQIKTRELPKKALVINLSKIVSANGRKEPTLDEAYSALKSAMLGGGFRTEVRDEARRICTEVGDDPEKIDLFDIYYSVPKPITTKNYTDVYVTTNDGSFVDLCEVANLNDWSGEFSGRSWNAYVFCSPKLLPIIGVAAKRVLERKGIVFSEKIAFADLQHQGKIAELIEKIGTK